MKNKKISVAAGALLCTTALSAFSPMLSTYAFDNSADGSSYFDINAQRCVVEGYNAENGTSITNIEQIDPEKLTTLDCSNRNISNFKGIMMLTKLESLNLSGNTKLNTDGQNFLVPASLKTLNISGVNSTYLDISNNVNLETLTVDRDVYLKTSAYIEKFNNEDEYAYGMNLSALKFLNSAVPTTTQTGYPAKYNSNTKTIAYQNNIPSVVPVKKGAHTYNILSRGGYMQSVLYFNDDKEDPQIQLVQENCKEGGDSENLYYVCDNMVYYGDTIDTEILIKKYNLTDYVLSKVEIVPPKANIKLDTDEETVKKGIALADANFTVKYYLDPNDLATPNTGVFTTEGATIVATTATLGIILTSLGLYVSQYVSKRQKSKIRFEKK